VSFKPYPKYKESGVEWLGRVPEHWDVTRLKHCVRLITAKAESRSNPLALENIEGWTGRLIPSEGDYQGEGTAFGSGDILFGKLRPYLAKVHLAERSGEAVGDFHVLRPESSLDGRFAQYGMLTREFIAIVDGSTYGSKMPRASWEFVGSMPMAVPPSIEQPGIATFLDHETAKIDALISEQQRLIELLHEKRQAVISHAVTKGLNPDAPMKDSGIEWLGEVPEHWKVIAVKHLARNGPKTFTDGDWIEAPFITEDGVRLLQTGNVGVGIFKEQGFRYVSENTFEVLGCTAVVPGDVLICRLDGPVGRACLAPDLGSKMITSVDNAILKASGDVLAEYVVYLMSSVPWLSWIDALCRVGGGFRLRVSRSQLGEIRVPLPPYEEQVTVAAAIRSATEISKTLANQATFAISLLQERRSALISAAVTGQIDVRGLSTGGGSEAA